LCKSISAMRSSWYGHRELQYGPQNTTTKKHTVRTSAPVRHPKHTVVKIKKRYFDQENSEVGAPPRGRDNRFCARGGPFPKCDIHLFSSRRSRRPQIGHDPSKRNFGLTESYNKYSPRSSPSRIGRPLFRRSSPKPAQTLVSFGAGGVAGPLPWNNTHIPTMMDFATWRLQLPEMFFIIVPPFY